jgi:hypothetical protein
MTDSYTTQYLCKPAQMYRSASPLNKAWTAHGPRNKDANAQSSADNGACLLSGHSSYSCS